MVSTQKQVEFMGQSLRVSYPMQTITAVDHATTTITREEIDQVERMLKVIDLRHRSLQQATRWLLIWTAVQDLTVRFACSSLESRNAVASSFENLLRSLAYTGTQVLEITNSLELTASDFRLGTDCDLESFKACVYFIEAKIAQWFAPKADNESVLAVWEAIA